MTQEIHRAAFQFHIRDLSSTRNTTVSQSMVWSPKQISTSIISLSFFRTKAIWHAFRNNLHSQDMQNRQLSMRPRSIPLNILLHLLILSMNASVSNQKLGLNETLSQSPRVGHRDSVVELDIAFDDDVDTDVVLGVGIRGICWKCFRCHSLRHKGHSKRLHLSPQFLFLKFWSQSGVASLEEILCHYCGRSRDSSDYWLL